MNSSFFNISSLTPTELSELSKYVSDCDALDANTPKEIAIHGINLRLIGVYTGGEVSRMPINNPEMKVVCALSHPTNWKLGSVLVTKTPTSVIVHIFPNPNTTIAGFLPFVHYCTTLSGANSMERATDVVRALAQENPVWAKTNPIDIVAMLHLDSPTASELASQSREWNATL